MAAAAFAATTALREDFFFRGHPAFFQRLGDKAIHAIRHFLQHVLSRNEGLDAVMGIGFILVGILLHALIGIREDDEHERAVHITVKPKKKQRTWFRTQLPEHRVLAAGAVRDAGELFAE